MKFLKSLFTVLITLTGINLLYISSCFASSCEDRCKQTTSCKSYLECQVGEMECLSACKQVEVSEKLIIALDKFAKTMEELVIKLNTPLNEPPSDMLTEDVPAKDGILFSTP